MSVIKTAIRGNALSVHLKNGFKLFVPSFFCDPGETVCLVGTNGSGKSVLLESLSGLGKCEGDIDVFHMENEIRRPLARKDLRIAAALQRFNLWGNARVSEILDLMAAIGLKTEGNDEFIQMIFNRFLGELSTGEKQYLMTLLALKSESDLLVLDEPTLGLDARMHERVIEFIRIEPRTTLMATHNFEDVLICADRCYFLCNGYCTELRIQRDTELGLTRIGLIEFLEEYHDDASVKTRLLKSKKLEIENSRSVELLNRELIPFVETQMRDAVKNRLVLKLRLSRSLHDEYRTCVHAQ